MRSCEGGRLRRANPHGYQLRANERHDLRGILTPKSNHGRCLHTATGGKGHSSIDPRNVAQGYGTPVRQQNVGEQSQLARQRASERDFFEKEKVAHAAIDSLGAAQAARVSATTQDERIPLPHRQRLVDYNSDSSAEDQQVVEARDKRSRNRRRMSRRKAQWCAHAAARAAAAVVTAATMAAPSDHAVASAVVAAAEKAVQGERGEPGAVTDPKRGVVRGLPHSNQAIQVDRPQRPMSRPAYRGRQPRSGKHTPSQEACVQWLSRPDSPRDDPAASIDNAIATINQDIAATSAYMNVLDVKFSESKQKLAAIELARAEHFSQTSKEGENLMSAAKAKELVDEYEERLGKACSAVRTKHHDQSFTRASADQHDPDTVAAAPLEAASDLAGEGSSSGGGGRQQVIKEGGFTDESREVNLQRAKLIEAVGQPGTGRAVEAATALRPEPGLSNSRQLQPPFECVPLYPWNTPIFRHAD